MTFGISRVLSVSRLLHSWIVAKRCEINACLLWNSIGKLISAFQNAQINLTLYNLEEVTAVKMTRIVLTVGPRPRVPLEKVFTIAQLIQVHLDLWPWLTIMGHFKATNVNIAYIFLIVRDTHVVTTWTTIGREINIGLPQSAENWPWMTVKHFKVTKVKMAHIVLTVAPRPRVPIDENVHHCQANKNAAWPLTLIDLLGSFQGYECENCTWRLTGEMDPCLSSDI
jgi:hypothetical protein